jgi:hypothetical protein
MPRPHRIRSLSYTCLFFPLIKCLQEYNNNNKIYIYLKANRENNRESAKVYI